MPILSATMPIQATGPVRFATLGNLAVLDVAGSDAVEFLQGQLTQDVKKLGDADARPAGYCTAKGRLLASAIVWRAAPDADGTPRVRLLVDASLAAALQKRLSMFVLRAKVRIAPATVRVAGIWGSAAALADAAGGALPDVPWQRAELPGGTWIAAPGGQSRWWWLGDDAQWDALAAALPGEAAGADAWQAADVAAGLPWITASTQDLFVPQMVNLELIDGVSFTKGCYPGQEIVARSHYLGKLKRRMFAGQVQADPAALAAADVFQDGDAQPCGRIVNAAREDGHAVILFESTLAAAGGGATLRAGAADGPAIALRPLPYPVPETQAS